MRHAWRDVFGVWQDTRLIVLVAQTAAVYAAILIPFKMGIPLIPGFTELRPANAFPVVASLLFGPAAAWGSGIGNVIGDCFGTLGPASLFGFLGNFAYGYVPYLLWGRLGPLSSRREPVLRSWRQTVEFGLVALAAALACAVIVAWGVDLLGFLPFRILAPAILLNNFLMAVLLAPPLLAFLYPRVTRWGLRYQDIRDTPGAARQAAAPDSRPPVTSVAPGAAFLAVEDFSFTYEGAGDPALRRLSLAVARGESVVVMGRSGSGKSTLCYAANGLIPQVLSGTSAGRVVVDGWQTAARPVWEQAGTTGLVFQEFDAQLVSTSVEMELAFPLECLRGAAPASRREMRERILRMLAEVGLAGLEGRNPLALSGGQRQRLVIASCLIREPALIALDEPLTDLDPAGRLTLALLLRNLQAAGATLLLAEHDPELAVQADRVCILDRGALVWTGRPRELFARPELIARWGVAGLPLAECFQGGGIEEVPLTVEEAWVLADEARLTVRPDHPVRDEPPAADRPVALSVERVSFAYERGREALAEVDLTIHQGDFVALLGRNGSGKSTLGRLLNGLLQPTEGRVLIQHRDSRRLRPGELAAAVGYVFQNPDHQIFAETVEAEVTFGPRNLGCAGEEAARRAGDALAAVGFGPEIAARDPFSLSKGDRQRIAVASVLAAGPPILIFDEPTTGLDAAETARMIRTLRRLHAEGRTIIMITHALSLVAALARRCIVLRDGRVMADGATRDVFRRLTNEKEAEALGVEVPSVTRFAARWGQTLLTPEEVRRALRARA